MFLTKQPICYFFKKLHSLQKYNFYKQEKYILYNVVVVKVKVADSSGEGEDGVCGESFIGMGSLMKNKPLGLDMS